jgi:hypothetical protein
VGVARRSLAAAQADQYVTCQRCGWVTYEFIARRPRELQQRRVARGQRIKICGCSYVVGRMLALGGDEMIVYVTPAEPE